MHGLLWRPTERAARGSRRLIVLVHGGPTGQALADWNPRVQYLVQRGWTVLQPNSRGSTGYGPDYRRALEGRWGELDTDDVVAGIRHALREGWGDAGLVALMGGSAGGLTVLNVAARDADLVAAVVALFPVTDLLALEATTDRFESGYTTRAWSAHCPRHAAGTSPTRRSPTRPRSRRRCCSSTATPTRRCHRRSPPRSTDALRRAGTPVERHVYEGEGHGWRRSATIADELDRIDSFLSRRLG